MKPERKPATIRRPTPAEVEQFMSNDSRVRRILRNTKGHIGGKVPKDLVERIKNIVYHVDGVTVSSLIEEGLMLVAKKYEASNDNQRYPDRSGHISAGRPMK